MPGNRRLKNLAEIHFVIGLIARYLASMGSRALAVPLIASVLCQAFILALWGVTSTASPWKRIAGLLAGSVYLETLCRLASKWQLPGIPGVTIAAASLLVVPEKGGRITLQVHNGPHGTERLRFSIRGLMLLTVAVALLSAVTRTLQGLEFPENGLSPIDVFLSLCFVAIGFAALWAVLGKAQPSARVAVVFVLSPILGIFFSIASNAHSTESAFVIVSMLLYSVALLLSLFVVRSCGYRFVRCETP